MISNQKKVEDVLRKLDQSCPACDIGSVYLVYHTSDHSVLCDRHLINIYNWERFGGIKDPNVYDEIVRRGL